MGIWVDDLGMVWYGMVQGAGAGQGRGRKKRSRVQGQR